MENEQKSHIIKKITPDALKMIFHILTSIIMIGVLAFSLACLSGCVINNNFDYKLFAATFLFLSLSRIPLILTSWFVEKKILIFGSNALCALSYLVVSILLFALNGEQGMTMAACIIYLATIIINRLAIMIDQKTLSSYIFNGLLSLVALSLIVMTIIGLGTQEFLMSTLTTALAIIMLVALAEILRFAFSRMKLKGIIKIMKKTYAFEILYGLLVLIVACSFCFVITEESITTFQDGLWYSFAIVTTIGLGDYTVTGFFSRFLSVLLGVYGIVVVAVLTSIIVNFYNDNKEKGTTDTDQIAKIIDEIRNKEKDKGSDENNKKDE